MKLMERMGQPKPKRRRKVNKVFGGATRASQRVGTPPPLCTLAPTSRANIGCRRIEGSRDSRHLTTPRHTIGNTTNAVAIMSYPARQTLPSHIRPSSGLANSNTSTSSTTQASLLQARINEKRVELESLRQLRDLSAGLAGQMQQLEQKLATLSDGTQAVAEVLGNWNSVLRALHMASTKIPRVAKEGEEEGEREELPQTLVRIPIQQAVAAQREAEAAAEAAGE